MKKTVKKVTEICLSAEELATIIRDHIIGVEGEDIKKSTVSLSYEGYQNTATDRPQINALNVVIETRI